MKYLVYLLSPGRVRHVLTVTPDWRVLTADPERRLARMANAVPDEQYARELIARLVDRQGFSVSEVVDAAEPQEMVPEARRDPDDPASMEDRWEIAPSVVVRH